MSRKRGRREAVQRRKSQSTLSRPHKQASESRHTRHSSRPNRKEHLTSRRVQRTGVSRQSGSKRKAMKPVHKVDELQLYRGGSSQSRSASSQLLYSKRFLRAAGNRDATQWGLADRVLSSLQLTRQMNQRFSQALQLEGVAFPADVHASYADVIALGRSYAEGYADVRNGIGADVVLLPTTMRLGAVLCAYNEQDSIATTLKQLARLPLDEIVIVVNGSVDRTFELARKSLPEAIVVHFDKPLGHDVGRAIGAKLLQVDAVLFTDCDFTIEGEQLGAYLWSIASGVDVALNDIRPFMDKFEQQDGISYCKQWLNQELGRSDLAMNSLTAIPHALSSKAIHTIGYEALYVPPRAHALAVLHGLHVQTACTVDVITQNRLRTTNIGLGNPVAQLIIGDHMEALEAVWNWKREELNAVQSVRADIAWRRNT
ncbi:glycosyltransferase family A protein [Paenibacillus arenosi]|uniref:Glycosyltransferase n=1 Tax=Paenibacillus arenosi TaxID=2774142 RepID=A0ABR9B1J2_9BACL|nr:glycosyltransferase family A protein [Paenibacillus arenosi]MBD8500251.1 glycosyltransferase [Paenibacillus arenosi]